jgi:hypothetical protein
MLLGNPQRRLVSPVSPSFNVILICLVVADYGFVSTRPAQGETLNSGSWTRWYLDLFIDGALKASPNFFTYHSHQ